MFKIGTKVKIDDNGKSYTTYKSWAKNNMPNYLKYYQQGKKPSKNRTIYTIVASAKHEYVDTILYGLYSEENKSAYIVSTEGLYFVEYSANDSFVINKDTLTNKHFLDMIDYITDKLKLKIVTELEAFKAVHLAVEKYEEDDENE